MAYLQALRQAKILWVMIILAGILAVLPLTSATDYFASNNYIVAWQNNNNYLYKLNTTATDLSLNYDSINIVVDNETSTKYMFENSSQSSGIGQFYSLLYNWTYSVDNNWNSFSACGLVYCYVYENYSIPYAMKNASVNFNFEMSGAYLIVNPFGDIFDYWNYTSNLWQKLFYDEGEASAGSVTYSKNIPLDGIKNNKILIQAQVGNHPWYYESNITYNTFSKKVNYTIGTNIWEYNFTKKIDYVPYTLNYYWWATNNLSQYGKSQNNSFKVECPARYYSFNNSLCMENFEFASGGSAGHFHTQGGSVASNSNITRYLNISSNTNYLTEGYIIIKNTNATNSTLIVGNTEVWSNNTNNTSIINVRVALNDYLIHNCSGKCNIPFTFNSKEVGELMYYAVNISNEGFFENYVNYSSSVIEGETTQINASFSIDIVPDSIILYYNNTAYTPNILTNGTTYFLSSWVIAPQVNENKNVSFYFTYSKSGNMSNSSLYNQTINNIGISLDCGAGTFLFLNITNYDEEILNLINGTVEWNLNLINSGFIIASSNGTATGYNISLCSSKNLSSSTSTYSLALRYYIINNSYFYKTYNIQANPGAGTPISIPLYYLNNSKGTQFNINYVNFNYFNHPGAIIQIQREYLAEGIYRVVEIPQINDDGLTVGSFNTNKIKYKLIVMNNGVILDIFDNIFPVCQNIILGTCNINLRGAESVTTTTEEDLIYTLTKSNTSITLTFVIPSGAPKNINFVAQQNSRFLTDISSYNSSLYASGGTFIYNYNNTIGDSIINTQINVNNQPSLYGSIIIAEDLSGFYILNNFFIAFVLLLALGLMFISSGVMIVIMAVLGLFYLSLIFLLRGADIVTISSSMIFFIIGSIIIIYKISKKEEKT